MAGRQLRKREQYEQLKAKLWTDRQSTLQLWTEVADYTKPTRLRLTVTDRNRNDKRNLKILDETAVFVLDTLESGLHAGMSSPARPWFKLAVPDPSLNDSESVKGYLHDVEMRMNAVFALSNFYNAVPEVYGDVSTFGTAAMACFNDAEDLVRFYTYPLGSYAVGLNKRREVCTFVLEEQYTVRQVVEEFGERDDSGTIRNREAFSAMVLNAWDREQYEDAVDVCWIVMPNNYADDDRLDAKYLPFTSCWFELGRTEHEGVLRESGFRTFPVMVPRWKTTGNDAYGTSCPGFTMLPAVKQLQKMEQKGNQLIAKAVDPPMQAPAEMKNQPTSMVAGHISFTPRGGPDGRITPLHEVNLQGLQHFEAKTEQVRERIRRAGFEKLLLMFQSNPYGQPMTAEEAKQRRQEMLMLFGPALERMNEELLEKIIDRLFDVMSAAGMLPEAPEELQGVTLKVEFTSVLAEALKLTRLGGLDALAQRIVPLAEFVPGIMDKFNGFAFVDEVARAVGANPRVIRSDEEAMAIAAERAQAAQAQAQAEQAAQLSTAAKNLGQTPMQGDSALSRIAESIGAA